MKARHDYSENRKLRATTLLIIDKIIDKETRGIRLGGDRQPLDAVTPGLVSVLFAVRTESKPNELDNRPSSGQGYSQEIIRKLGAAAVPTLQGIAQDEWYWSPEKSKLAQHLIERIKGEVRAPSR